ncbi:MAG: DNA mismatch repair protein MutT [Phenylobacterium zucineum]|nr:MAG: DNA mismatch repair protein MutT [Phenylobacterium zucineum]
MSQYAALPWRQTAEGRTEVLLISSRETRRWIIPKGWPMKKLHAADCAAREAFEEAGVEGDVRRKKVGVFHYDKSLSNGRLQPVRVSVFALQVSRECVDFPEKGQRDRLWTTPFEASVLVDEPELKALFLGFMRFQLPLPEDLSRH